MANPEEQTSSEDKKGADPEGSLQGSLAGWVPDISLSDVADTLVDVMTGAPDTRERTRFIHPSGPDATTAYANNNDYYIYFYYVPSGGGETFVKFKAILTSFDDMYISAWREEDIYGRMDPIATYQSTKRQISFSFDVVADSLVEAIQNYKNSKRLLSYLYPVYEEASTQGFTLTSIKAPPLMKIKFANLINEKIGKANLPLVGKLGGLSYRPTIDVGFFEDGQKLYPKVNSFACNFTVLHTQDPVLSTTDLGRPDLRPPVEPAAAAREADQKAGTAKAGTAAAPTINNDNDATQAQLQGMATEVDEADILRGVQVHGVSRLF